MKSWTFEGHSSVRWLIEHPLPLFLCVVLKKEALLRVYQTTPRFYAWSLPPLPQRLELIPGEGVDGHPPTWIDGTKFSLSAPILEFTIQESLEEGFVQKAKAVLQFWNDVDLENLHRLQSGVLNFKVPAPYKTGECKVRGWATQGVNRAEREAVDRGIARLKESLDWVSDQLFKNGDLPGAIRGMLLLRHLYWDEHHSPMSLSNGFDLANILGRNSPRWVNQVVDELGSEVDYGLVRDLRDTSRLAGVRRLYLGDSSITDQEIACLSHATELRYLSLANTRVTDKALRYLKPMTCLRELHLGGTSVTGPGLVHLKGLFQLEALGLSDTKVDDKSVRHLKELPRLENLFLNNTSVTTKSVAYLKGLPCLNTLTLNGTGVDDKSLKLLRECTGLRRLEVGSTKVTEAEVDDFRKARPNVAVLA
jgi:hypothetical protein